MHIRPKQIDEPIIGRDLNVHQVRRGVIIAIKAIINKMILLSILKIYPLNCMFFK